MRVLELEMIPGGREEVQWGGGIIGGWNPWRTPGARSDGFPRFVSDGSEVPDSIE